MDRLTNIIEGILFASGDAITEDFIREKLQISKIEMDKCIRQLEKKYSGECGIRFLHFNHKMQFASNPDYKDEIASVLNQIREKEFTRTILECAAIIAYKQPITRSELEAMRGVNSDYALTTLQNLDMVYPCGRKDSPGKPVLFATTDNFLKRFNIKSLKELPDYDILMQKINEYRIVETSNYLYEKDTYNPEEEEQEEKIRQAEEFLQGFEIPEMLEDEEELVRIE